MAATTAQSPWTMSLPISVMSLFSLVEDGAKTSDDMKGMPALPTDSMLSKKPFLSTFYPNTVVPGPSSPSKSDGSIMFAEPDAQDTRSNSSGDVSKEGSIMSKEGRRRFKRSSRPKTCFSICHPPPTSNARQKLHRRPRSLLQLHRLSPHARPVPALEVIPSANFSVRLTRAITKVFTAKHGLCPHDLVVLRAEKYYTEDQDEAEEERDVVALICKGRKEDSESRGKMKVCLKDGVEWEAYGLINGGYELSSTDEHGLDLTVRWVPKKCKDGKTTHDKRFNFSTISPNSRRHPVIASLSKSGIDINDTYTIPTPAAHTPLSTPNLNPVDDAEDPDIEAKDRVETDERLRTLITVSGLWVAFKEGWSPHFKYDEVTIPRSPSMQNSPTKSGMFATRPRSPLPGDNQKRNSIRSVGGRIIRSSSLLRNNRMSVASVDSATSGSVTSAGSTERAPSQSGGTTKGRARGDSTSTVLVHRAASNRRKNNQQATWRPDLLQAQHQLNETSREDLTRNTPSPQPCPSASRKPSHEPATAIPDARSSSVARPLIQEPPQSNSIVSTLPRGERPLSPEQQESSTTTSTDDAPPKTQTERTSKRKRTWRRLLCGMAD